MGYFGDEDNGSMVVWYIFNSLGFYFVILGIGEYVIGMFLMDKVVVFLLNGKELMIEVIFNWL